MGTVAQRQFRLVGAVMAAVVAVDQTAKWLAWRHFEGTLINSGGYILLGRTVRAWLAAPVAGRIADVAGSVLLAAAVWYLLRDRRPRTVLLGAALVVGGFASNIGDRFGLHHLTAPGSVRGVVDFIPSGGASRCNVADLLIVAGALVLANAAIRRAVVRRDDG